MSQMMSAHCSSCESLMVSGGAKRMMSPCVGLACAHHHRQDVGD